MENRWLDRLKILTWHSSLATQTDVKSACSREHLKVLIAYWLEQANLRLASPAKHLPIPIAGWPDRDKTELDDHSEAQVIGELSVCREPLSPGWTGSPEAFDGILDALIPAEIKSRPSPVEVRIFEPRLDLDPSQSRFSQGRISPGLVLF
jgi:hypothetical protein